MPSPAAAAAAATPRPGLIKRQSSQSSQSSARSPPSEGHALRVKPRHAKIVLPRTHSSSRSLAKLTRQAHTSKPGDDVRRHTRQRSHEGDTEIRLPGSLDESRPPIKRTLTAFQLPRTTSHAKLKKNLSHGQLTRLGSGRNLAALASAAHRAPPSPGLKGKHKRPKSAEIAVAGQELQLRESEPRRRPQEERQLQRPQPQRKGSGKKVGFAVGSAGSSSQEDAPEMEGSGMQEDEWTEESASASPYGTRQNTANNSRRTSMVIEHPADRQTPGQLLGMKLSEPAPQHGQPQDIPSAQAHVAVDSDDNSAPSPRSVCRAKKPVTSQTSEIITHSPQNAVHSHVQTTQHPLPTPGERPSTNAASQATLDPAGQSPTSQTVPASPLAKANDHSMGGLSKNSQARDYANPGARRLMSGQRLAGPAIVSNVSALDDHHSRRRSPALSMRSSRSNIGDEAAAVDPDELVSRFMPSASHPPGSGGVDAAGTPKQSGFHTPEVAHSYSTQHHEKGFQVGPVSPGSTISGSSGATTPAAGRSRTELRLLQEKALADMESRTDTKPHLPAWQYDRRNESLRSFMSGTTLGNSRNMPSNGLGMGPEIFQGRFRAVNTELRLVQKFRDPLGESVARLRNCAGSKMNQRSSAPRPNSAGIAPSKSAVHLPAPRRPSNSSKPASPPTAGEPPKGAAHSSVRIAGGSERQRVKREVSFAGAPQTREFRRELAEGTPFDIATELWNDFTT